MSDEANKARDFYADDGSLLGSVVHHPRIEGAWLAKIAAYIDRNPPPARSAE